MNCKKCGIALRDGARFCHICGASQVASSLPKFTPDDWFSFIRSGNYTLKYKLNSDLEISWNKRVVGLLSHINDDKNNYYDLVQSEQDEFPVVRFVRTDNSLDCVDPDSGHVFFSWKRLSSSLGEMASGSKWSCGGMSFSQSALRSFSQWLPTISWFIPTKYTVYDKGAVVGAVSGSATSLSNSKTAEVKSSAHAWAILAVAIILSDDEIG